MTLTMITLITTQSINLNLNKRSLNIKLIIYYHR